MNKKIRHTFPTIIPFLWVYNPLKHIIMKITLSQVPYTHILDIEEDPQKNPPLGYVLDAFLYLLTLHYPTEEVIKEAHEWFP